MMDKQHVLYEWIQGKTYEEVWDYQTSLHQSLIDIKRGLTGHIKSEEIKVVHHLLLCQHNPVYTLGKSGSTSNLLSGEEVLKAQGVEFFKINRGGDITYHGPGQITGYPIFDLDYFYTDVHRYVRELEEVIIQVLKEYKIKGVRIPKYTGVWIEDNVVEGSFRKICAIGVHLSRWVTLHGFAFNVNTELSYFNQIIPCGIQENHLTVTSLENELGKKVDLKEVEEWLKLKFERIFNIEYI
ncbi:MAG: lipoyl(octanoyl) transferase LipB [Saprospiraceae bacterium]